MEAVQSLLGEYFTVGISLVIGKCNHFVLAFRTPNSTNENAIIYAFLMISERPKRDRKLKVIWEAAELSSTASRPKKHLELLKLMH